MNVRNYLLGTEQKKNILWLTQIHTKMQCNLSSAGLPNLLHLLLYQIWNSKKTAIALFFSCLNTTSQNPQSFY